jgi:hypothetical protein
MPRDTMPYVAALNPDYQEWVADFIKPVTYDVHNAAYSWHWEDVQPTVPDDTKVVMITQLSVSRCAQVLGVNEPVCCVRTV